MLCLNITFYIDKQPRKWYAEKNLSVEVVNLSKAKYPNRDALREANDIYLDAMRPFIIHHLKQIPGETVEDLIRDALTDEQADKFWEMLDKDNGIESAIDFSYFPLIIKNRWLISRNRRNYGFAQRFNEDMTVQSMLWLIKEGRNSCEHRGKKDLDSEFVRINLYLIADVLGKINRPDEQREVEAIRDELFPDTTEHLEKAQERLKDLESEKSAAEKRLADVELKKKEYEEENAALSTQVDEKENQRKKLDKQLKGKRTQNDKYKKDIAGAKQRLEKSEAAQAEYKNRLETKLKELKDTEMEKNDYKERFETISKELEEAKTEWQTCEDNLKAKSDQLEDAVGAWMTSMESLTAMRKLFMTATIGEPKIQAVFPSIKTDSIVRILDRRGVEKKNYLLDLLEQRQPTIIYVQSEEKIDQLLTLVGPEKADVIGKCNERTSAAEKKEILEKLEKGELTAIVSNTAFSTLTSTHCVEHFVFCHLVPGLDEFYKQCEPAFTSGKNAYLHLIYNSEQDVEGLNQWLTQKYPDAEALGKLYREMRELTETDDGFIKPENIYDKNICNKLGIAKLGVETGLTIFEELQFLERNESGVKVLPDPEKRGLDESEIYCGGEELKHGVAEVRAFQLKQPIEQIWEEIKEKLDVGSEQILREIDTNEMYASVSEMESDRQPTETVENDSETDDGDTDSELAEEDSENRPEVERSEFWQPIRTGEFGELFTGKPVPVGDDGWISKRIRGVEIILSFRKNRSYVSFLCKGENRIERRDKIIALFSESDYDYSPHESPQRAGFRFPVINKGKDHPEDWDEIREKLVAMGTDIYNKIDESDL